MKYQQFVKHRRTFMNICPKSYHEVICSSLLTTSVLFFFIFEGLVIMRRYTGAETVAILEPSKRINWKTRAVSRTHRPRSRSWARPGLGTQAANSSTRWTPMGPPISCRRLSGRVDALKIDGDFPKPWDEFDLIQLTRVDFGCQSGTSIG